MQEAPLYHSLAEASPDGRAHWIKAADDVRLRVAHWPAQEAGRGTIFLFPGRTEYIEKHGRTVAELNKRGFGALVIDWRGQGLSDRVAKTPFVGHVARFSDYQLDVAAMIALAERLALPRPWFLLCHSMGGLIGLEALGHGLNVQASAFCAPMWALNLSVFERAILWPLTFAMTAVGRGAHFAPGNRAQQDQCYVQSVSFEHNRLTHDPDMYRFMIAQAEALPHMQIGAPSHGWVLEALRSCRGLSLHRASDMPTLVFCGNTDALVDSQKIKAMVEHLPHGRFVELARGKHDLLCEVPNMRDKVITGICAHFEAAL